MGGDRHDLSIAELSRAVAARTLSPVELTEALIRRVEAHEGQVHAFITPTFERARQQARHAEAEIAAGRWRGPLHHEPAIVRSFPGTLTGVTRLRGRSPRRSRAGCPPASA
jgi:aspartyl-tRNA(Asn)/glutamyl-tRNA(Gln) amidotransferase subunit A